MKILKSSLLLLSLAGTLLNASSTDDSNSLVNAIKNGKTSGDMTMYYESRNADKAGHPYYKDSAYGGASIGLTYETAKFNNFSAAIGFRGHALWEDKDGDAIGWINDGKSTILQTGYIAYDTENVHVKVGRQTLFTEWLPYRANDAITAYITPFEKAELELIYTARYAAISPSDFSLIENYGKDKNDGVTKVGLSYAFSDSLNAKVYGIAFPFEKDVYGAKLNFNTMSNDVNYGGYVHYTNVKEDRVSENGSMYDAQVYAGMSGWNGHLGYTKNSNGALGRIAYKDPANSLGYIGDDIVLFDEADQMYLTVGDNTTYYMMVSTNVAGIDLSCLYGITDYDYGTSTEYSKQEFNFRTGYSFNKDLRLGMSYMITKEDTADANFVDMKQFNTTLTYMF